MVVKEVGREREVAGGQEDLRDQGDSEGRVELLGREEREGWESVRSDIFTAREITKKPVVVMFCNVATIESVSGLTNFLPLMTLIIHVAKEEEVKVNHNCY